MTADDRNADATFVVVLARMLGVAPQEVPQEAGERRAWLAQRGLGLVPVADAAGFSWAGP